MPVAAVRAAPMAPGVLPVSVQEIIGRRIAHLSQPTRRALSVAAVLGREFRVDAVARIDDAAHPPPATWLDEAIRAHVVTAVERNRARFAHALVHEAFYTQLEVRRRRALHRRAGEVLESSLVLASASDLAALAHHF